MTRDERAVLLKELLRIAEETRKFGYNPARFLQDVFRSERDPGALVTRYVRNPPSDGFARLFEEKRLDLTVENVAWKFRRLFPPDVAEAAAKRLSEAGFDVDAQPTAEPGEAGARAGAGAAVRPPPMPHESAATFPPLIATRLEKAAADNGFDRPLGGAGEWLAFESTHAPLRIWLGLDPAGLPVVAISRADVHRALGTLGTAVERTLPPGAVAARVAAGFDVLHQILRRAYQLARTLPNGLLDRYRKETRSLPSTTEAERLVVQRVGQDVFRAGLLEYWQDRCAVTGLAVPALLRASHIKPWAKCDTDAERLDVFNGILLAPHLDAAFDAGFITVADDGAVLVSPLLTEADRAVLGLDRPLRISRLAPEHRVYLAWHRAKEFRTREA